MQRNHLPGNDMLRFIKRRKDKNTDAQSGRASAVVEQGVEKAASEAASIAAAGTATDPASGTTTGDAAETTRASGSNRAGTPAASGEGAAAAKEITATAQQANTEAASNPDARADQAGKENQGGFFRRLAAKLGKTGSSLGDGIGQILLGKKEIDDELLEDIETQLLVADVGVDTTQKIITALAGAIERDALTDPAALYTQLKNELKRILGQQNRELAIDANRAPFVVLVVGVNGAGKTTTIGKLAKQLQGNNFSVALAAGDTFRAAAVEQLQVWGERNAIEVIAQHTGADSASVIFDGLQASKARDIDVLLADTAGRLHNKDNLMEELKKVVRVMKKIDASAPHEVLLVLDATTGQNAIVQAKTFQQAVGVTGIAVTKLDGTAKGGVVFAISDQLGLPIRFIGVGEKIEDLRPFEPDEFVEALFDGVTIT
ncbi:MAG: signal recognition particle-docking protein FtsY [Pseudomonadales bacterium]